MRVRELKTQPQRLHERPRDFSGGGIVRSAWGHAESSRNDWTLKVKTSINKMCQVIRSRVIAPGTVYVCGEREYFGRFPVRTELTVINADTFLRAA